MTVTLSHKELADAFGKASLALTSGIDIYRQLHVLIGRKWVVITGMSSETTIKTVVRHEATGAYDKEAVFLVHPEIAQAIATLPDGDIDLKLVGSNLQVTSEHGPKFSFRIGDAESYPKLTVGSKTDAVIPGEVLRRSASYLAATRSDIVKISNTDAKLVLASTDSYRLALVRTGVDFVPKEAVVPSYLFSQAEKVFDLESEVKLVIDDTRVSLRQDDTLLSVRRSEKKFPGIESILKGFEVAGTFEVERRLLLGALNRGHAIVGSYLPMRLMLQPKVEGAEAMTMKVDVGQSDEHVVGEWDGPDMEVRFNIPFMRDILGAITGPTVKLQFQDATTQFRVVSDGDPLVTFIVMPVRPT